MITKSDFLKYLECPSFLRFWKNDPEVLLAEKSDPFIQRLKSQEYEVERFSRNLYPSGELIIGLPIEAASKTARIIKDGTTAIYQASFVADNLFANTDILVCNVQLSGWDIIEVKSSTHPIYLNLPSNP